MEDAREQDIEATILDFVAGRGPDKTVCPSEVARRLGGPDARTWRPLMAPIKRAALRLARTGRIAILQKGEPVADLAELRGIYRIGMPRRPPRA